MLQVPAMIAFIQPLLHGAAVTALITLGAIAIAIPAMAIADACRFSGIEALDWPARVYIEIFRGTSALIQLFWVFYALPLITPLHPSPMVSAIVVLGLNGGAYGAEIVRGALLAVSRQQKDAAIALNFSRWQTFYRIVLPQAVPLMLPPLANLFIDMLKNSALAGLVQVSDLTFQAQLLQDSTLRSGAVYGAALVIYFAMAMVLALLMRLLEKLFRFPVGVRA